MTPKLSVICLTYNHAKFIRQALDGFVMQKTNFPFEVIIHDDASTDGTADIIREYEQKYPNIIKPIYQTENQWGKKHIWRDIVFPLVKGEYVALCEGDDYWIDPCKLQKQVDFLDAHSDYSICFHPVNVKWEEKSQPDELFPNDNLLNELGDMSFESLLRCNFTQTNSVVYRWRFHKDSLSLLPDYIQPGDWFLHLLHAQIGKIGFLPDVMAVYRKHQGGIWFQAGKSDLHYVNHGLRYLNFIIKVKEQFGYYNEQSSIDFAKDILFALLNHKEFGKLKQFSEQFSEFYVKAIQYITDQIDIYQKTEFERRHKQNRWRKLCGRIVKKHKTTYYFLYVPVLRIKYKNA